MKELIKRRPFISFVVLAISITAFLIFPIILNNRGFYPIELPNHWEALGAFGPFLAGIIVAYVIAGKKGVKRLFTGLTHWRVGWFWVLFTCLTPYLFFWAAAFQVQLTSGSLPEFSLISTSYLATTAGFIKLVFFGSIIQSLGEEPGWRGQYADGMLENYSAFKTAAVMGPLWILWHVPAFLTRPEFGLIQFAGISAGLFFASFWLTLIYVKTRSILMVFIWHALLNMTRFATQQISTSFFLAYATPVILGGIVIGVYFLIYKPTYKDKQLD